MLVDRYVPEDVFARVPELAGQTDRVLVEMDRLLDDEELYQQVRTDLGHRARLTLIHGRHSTPAEVILRLLVIKHLYTWSYEETMDRVRDSLVLRWFTRVYFARVPDATTLLRWAHTITPATLDALNERVVHLAQQAKVTQGRKLRLDGTCMQTTIHHPTDSGLLVDGVRVLTRSIGRARQFIENRVDQMRDLFRNRWRSTRATAQIIHRRRRYQAQDTEQQQAYAKLIQISEQVVRQAQTIATALAQRGERAAQRLRQGLQMMVPRVQQVIGQARRRVLQGEAVPASDKIVSLFEPHTRIIPRLKAGAQVEFGKQVVLHEVEGGIVTGWTILPTASEQQELVPALQRHQRLFGKPPKVVAADRGHHTLANRRSAVQYGVGLLAIPWKGRPPPDQMALQHSRRWRRAYRWRAGIEGRIHVLRRDFGLAKCRDHGEIGMQRAVGWGILAHNLRQIARKTANA